MPLIPLFAHRIYSPGRERVYWNGNIASDEKNATHAVVQTRTGAYSWEMQFTWPEQKNSVEKLEAMLDAAYGAGALDAKKNIRKSLGIEEPWR